jgi:hypothetical protein
MAWHTACLAGRGMRLRITLLALLVSQASVALACPSCPIGRAARQQVCSDGFATKLWAVVLPFLVIGVLTAWVERRVDRAPGQP